MGHYSATDRANTSSGRGKSIDGLLGGASFMVTDYKADSAPLPPLITGSHCTQTVNGRVANTGDAKFGSGLSLGIFPWCVVGKMG